MHPREIDDTRKVVTLAVDVGGRLARVGQLRRKALDLRAARVRQLARAARLRQARIARARWTGTRAGPGSEPVQHSGGVSGSRWEGSQDLWAACLPPGAA
jgi:hypothetical protein